MAARAGQIGRLAGLRRIGIDEISYRKGQRYLLVVTDHDTGRMVWASKDRTKQTLGRFFDDLGADRAAALTTSAPMEPSGSTMWSPSGHHARWECLDAFHVVTWATEALDKVRRAMVNQLRADGHIDEATEKQPVGAAETPEPDR